MLNMNWKIYIVTWRAQKLVACEKTPMTTLLFQISMDFGQRFKQMRYEREQDMSIDSYKRYYGHKLFTHLVSGAQRSNLGWRAGFW